MSISLSFYSMLMLLLMSFVGKSKTVQNMIRYMGSSSPVRNGHMLAHSLGCYMYVFHFASLWHIILSLILCSMPITLNKHSHMRVFQHFTLLFLYLKPFIGHGPVVLNVLNMSIFLLLFMLHVTRLMTTTRKQQSPLHTLWQ